MLDGSDHLWNLACLVDIIKVTDGIDSSNFNALLICWMYHYPIAPGANQYTVLTWSCMLKSFDHSGSLKIMQ